MYGGKLAFQNRLRKLIDDRKFTVFGLFYFVFKGKFQIQAPGGLFSEGRFNGGFFCVTSLEGLIFGILRYFHLEIFLSQFDLRSTPLASPYPTLIPAKQPSY